MRENILYGSLEILHADCTMKLPCMQVNLNWMFEFKRRVKNEILKHGVTLCYILPMKKIMIF
jgi:hypothetical protein